MGSEVGQVYFPEGDGSPDDIPKVNITFDLFRQERLHSIPEFVDKPLVTHKLGLRLFVSLTVLKKKAQCQVCEWLVGLSGLQNNWKSIISY